MFGGERNVEHCCEVNNGLNIISSEIVYAITIAKKVNILDSDVLNSMQ